MAGSRKAVEKARKKQASAKIMQIREAINRFLTKTQRIVKAVAPHARLVRNKPIPPHIRPRNPSQQRKKSTPDTEILTKTPLNQPEQTQISIPQFRGTLYEGRNPLF